MALGKDQLLQKGRPSVREVKIPEIDETVFIRTMTGSQRDTFETKFTGKTPAGNVRGVVCAWVLSDEDGNRLFTDEDAEAVGDLDVRVLTRVFDAAIEQSALSSDELEAIAGN